MLKLHNRRAKKRSWKLEERSGKSCGILFSHIAGGPVIEPLGTNFSEILIEIHTFSFKEMHWKMSSGKWRPFCVCHNVLIIHISSLIPTDCHKICTWFYIIIWLYNCLIFYSGSPIYPYSSGLLQWHLANVMLVPVLMKQHWGIWVKSPFWSHQMETFSMLLALCEGNPGGFPSQRPVTWSFDVFFDAHLNKNNKTWATVCMIAEMSCDSITVTS